MMGLVRKHLTAGYINPLWTFVFLAICAAISFLARSTDWFMVIFCAVAGGFVANYVFHFLGSNDANWRKLESVMPVKAVYVELSRYLSHLIVFAVTLAGGAVYALINYLSGAISDLCRCRKDSYELCSCTFSAMVVDGLAMWCSMFLLFGAIFFLISRIQTNIVAAAQVVSLVLVVFVVGVFGALVSTESGGIGAWNWVLVGVTLVFYVGSYFLSLCIFKYRQRTKGAL
ncbi:MAG: ABC-2 transporter permease [Firmicutes bacterium]|nr:ABC-2 transporter permease [Bacillota bacterium]